jgi:mercuric ion transport protein
MTDLQTRPAPMPRREAGRDAVKTSLAAAGLLAAIGVAASCALPVALGALGIGSAALIGIGMLVGPYQVPVLAAALACLMGAAFILWRQRQARVCTDATQCARPALDWISQIAIALALGLLALTFWIEPPL